MGKAQQKAQHNENKVSTSWQETDFPNLGAESDSWKGNERPAPRLGAVTRNGGQAVLLPSQPEAETKLKSVEAILKRWWEKD